MCAWGITNIAQPHGTGVLETIVLCLHLHQLFSGWPNLLIWILYKLVNIRLSKLMSVLFLIKSQRSMAKWKIATQTAHHFLKLQMLMQTQSEPSHAGLGKDLIFNGTAHGLNSLQNRKWWFRAQPLQGETLTPWTTQQEGPVTQSWPLDLRRFHLCILRSTKAAERATAVTPLLDAMSCRCVPASRLGVLEMVLNKEQQVTTIARVFRREL